MILILEDNNGRILEMHNCLHGITEFKIVRRVDEFILFYTENANKIIGISLDHDLEKSDPNESDPGDGRDVVKWMCDNSIRLPVVIHTSNSIMGDSMYFNLIDNGNSIDRIDPYDDLVWIRQSWIQKVINHFNLMKCPTR